MGRLLVVDDDQAICWGLCRLAQGLGHEPRSVSSAEEALTLVQRKAFDAVLLDVRMAGMSGLAAIEPLRARLGQVPIVVMTAYGDLATAVDAVRQGAFEYLLKPFDLAVAERVIGRAMAAEPPPVLPPQKQQPASDMLVGTSAVMQDVFKQVALVAHSEACVHLCGESGTGKELVARAIHRYSPRRNGPFVAVNLASLSPTLAESELFGHARGAFTGATAARAGLLEQARGGTIFLDEVADVPPPLQVKLLRALEHSEILPVGSTTSVATDFRVISATHQDLGELVARGQFRHDLFFRLNTFEIRLPSLRERPGDIPELAEHFIGLVAARSGMHRRSLSSEAATELGQRPWYGNVRELRNAIEHAMIRARGGAILPEHLPTAAAATDGPQASSEQINRALREWAAAQWQSGDVHDLYEQLLSLVEPPVLEVALERNGGQCAAAARSLGLHRVTLRKKLERFFGDAAKFADS